jgi:hypothetical protein
MQLTTPEIVALGIGAIEGVLSFLSAVLPKPTEEESIVNNILNLIHGAGFNSYKIVKPKSKKAEDSINSLISITDEALKTIKSIADSLKPTATYYQPYNSEPDKEKQSETVTDKPATATVIPPTTK